MWLLHLDKYQNIDKHTKSTFFKEQNANVMTYRMFVFRGEAVPCRVKKQSIGIKSFYSDTSNGVEYNKNCIGKLSIKMSIKRKTRARKAYAYQILLWFKASVTYSFLNFMPDNRICCEAAFDVHVQVWFALL